MPLIDAAVVFQGPTVAAGAPDGKHVALLSFPKLRVYQRPGFHLVREIDLPPAFDRKTPFIRWAPAAKGYSYSVRLLVCDRDTALVYDLEDAEWSATIKYGNQSLGVIANAEFGVDEFEVLTYPRFGAPLTIWSLYDGSQTDIKDPKFPGRGAGYSRKGRDAVFALIHRAGADESISIHIPECQEPYKEISRVTLGKCDTGGLRWSPSGKVFAVWQAARNGYEVSMHSAEGHRLRVYKGDYFEDQLAGLGVHTVQWDPSGKILAVGAYDRALVLLKAGTMTAAEYLYHRTNVTSAQTKVFVEETAPPASETPRHYQLIDRRPYGLPHDAALPHCISTISYNCNGTFVATRDDSMGNCAWVWSLTHQSCDAVLVQMSKIKKFLWHPTDPSSLTIQTEAGGNILYRFDAEAKAPHVLTVNMPQNQMLLPQVDATYLPSASSENACWLLSDKASMCVAYPDGRDALTISGSDAQEEDSLFDIVSGAAKSDGLGESQVEYESSANELRLEDGSVGNMSAHWRAVGAF